MPDRSKIALGVTAGIAAFSLLLLIISVGTPVWLDDGNGNSVGLFRKCIGDSTASSVGLSAGCVNENRVTQGGLSVFGLLLLVFAIVAIIAAIFVPQNMILLGALVLLYFSSMFVMSAYATWGTYARDPYLYFFPYSGITITGYTSMGYSYHLCVAAHYFLWTALTMLAGAVGYSFGRGPNEA